MARTPLTLPFSGPKLRALRETRGWFQDELARRCAEAGHPVNRATLSRIETGANKPVVTLLPVLAAVFDVEVDAFMDDQADTSAGVA